jgi:tryptophan synthase alpha chain
MSALEAKFKELKEKNEGALIGFLTLGDPDVKTSKKLAECLMENVDVLELGIPFSDPIADGPTIQASVDRALNAGINTDKVFELVSELKKKVPLVFLTYYNILLQYGIKKFIKRCSEAGISGIIVADLPIEEAGEVLEHCDKYDVDFIFLIAPTTTDERLKEIVSKARGFIYLISILGVTGARESLQDITTKTTKWALKHTKGIPLAVGFGISKKEHVQTVIKAGAQGVIVGSAFVDIIAKKKENACGELKKLSKELKDGTRA